MHAAWNKRCVELLDGLRSRWFEGCDEGARVGAVAARVATELLDEELSGGTHGIWISATHGSVDETYATHRAGLDPRLAGLLLTPSGLASDRSWEFTGPRFYASVITAALRPHTGCCGADGTAAARAPEGLEALLWPAAADAEAPATSYLLTSSGSRRHLPITAHSLRLTPHSSPPTPHQAGAVGDGAGLDDRAALLRPAAYASEGSNPGLADTLPGSRSPRRAGLLLTLPILALDRAACGHRGRGHGRRAPPRPG